MRSRALSKSSPVYPFTTSKSSYSYAVSAPVSNKTSPDIQHKRYTMNSNSRSFVPSSHSSNESNMNNLDKKIHKPSPSPTFISSSHGGTNKVTKNKYLCAIDKYKLKNDILGGEVVIFDEKINMEKYTQRLKDYTDGAINICNKKLDINLSATINPKPEYDNIVRGYVKGFDDSGNYAIVHTSRRYYMVPFDEVSCINVKTAPVNNFYK
jgi:hypothetical protein